MAEFENLIIKNIESLDGPSRMVIKPLGARLEELQLAGVKILTKVTRGDGKIGSSHPCAPIFGPEENTNTSFGLTQHGPVRDEICAVEQVSDHAVDLFHEIKSGTYPEGLIISQKYFVSTQLFSLVTIHINMGETPTPVNFGEHFYWDAPEGWKGLRINGEDVTGRVENDLVVSLQKENEILIPGKPKIVLVQEGFRVANLWVGKNKQTGQYDTHYVCIEPVERDPNTNPNPFGLPESMIAPGSARIVRVSITV